MWQSKNVRVQRRAREKREREDVLTEGCYFNCFNSVLVMGDAAMALHPSCRLKERGRGESDSKSHASGLV